MENFFGTNREVGSQADFGLSLPGIHLPPERTTATPAPATSPETTGTTSTDTTATAPVGTPADVTGTTTGSTTPAIPGDGSTTSGTPSETTAPTPTPDSSRPTATGTPSDLNTSPLPSLTRTETGVPASGSPTEVTPPVTSESAETGVLPAVLRPGQAGNGNGSNSGDGGELPPVTTTPRAITTGATGAPAPAGENGQPGNGIIKVITNSGHNTGDLPATTPGVLPSMIAAPGNDGIPPAVSPTLPRVTLTDSQPGSVEATSTPHPSLPAVSLINGSLLPTGQGSSSTPDVRPRPVGTSGVLDVLPQIEMPSLGTTLGTGARNVLSPPSSGGNGDMVAPPAAGNHTSGRPAESGISPLTNILTNIASTGVSQGDLVLPPAVPALRSLTSGLNGNPSPTNEVVAPSLVPPVLRALQPTSGNGHSDVVPPPAGQVTVTATEGGRSPLQGATDATVLPAALGNSVGTNGLAAGLLNISGHAPAVGAVDQPPSSTPRAGEIPLVVPRILSGTHSPSTGGTDTPPQGGTGDGDVTPPLRSGQAHPPANDNIASLTNLLTTPEILPSTTPRVPTPTQLPAPGGNEQNPSSGNPLEIPRIPPASITPPPASITPVPGGSGDIVPATTEPVNGRRSPSPVGDVGLTLGQAAIRTISDASGGSLHGADSPGPLTNVLTNSPIQLSPLPAALRAVPPVVPHAPQADTLPPTVTPLTVPAPSTLVHPVGGNGDVSGPPASRLTSVTGSLLETTAVGGLSMGVNAARDILNGVRPGGAAGHSPLSLGEKDEVGTVSPLPSLIQNMPFVSSGGHPSASDTQLPAALRQGARPGVRTPEPSASSGDVPAILPAPGNPVPPGGLHNQVGNIVGTHAAQLVDVVADLGAGAGIRRDRPPTASPADPVNNPLTVLAQNLHVNGSNHQGSEPGPRPQSGPTHDTNTPATLGGFLTGALTQFRPTTAIENAQNAAQQPFTQLLQNALGLGAGQNPPRTHDGGSIPPVITSPDLQSLLPSNISTRKVLTGDNPAPVQPTNSPSSTLPQLLRNPSEISDQSPAGTRPRTGTNDDSTLGQLVQNNVANFYPRGGVAPSTTDSSTAGTVPVQQRQMSFARQAFSGDLVTDASNVSGLVAAQLKLNTRAVDAAGRTTDSSSPFVTSLTGDRSIRIANIGIDSSKALVGKTVDANSSIISLVPGRGDGKITISSLSGQKSVGIEISPISLQSTLSGRMESGLTAGIKPGIKPGIALTDGTRFSALGIGINALPGRFDFTVAQGNAKTQGVEVTTPGIRSIAVSIGTISGAGANNPFGIALPGVAQVKVDVAGFGGKPVAPLLGSIQEATVKGDSATMVATHLGVFSLLPNGLTGKTPGVDITSGIKGDLGAIIGTGTANGINIVTGLTGLNGLPGQQGIIKGDATGTPIKGDNGIAGLAIKGDVSAPGTGIKGDANQGFGIKPDSGVRVEGTGKVLQPGDIVAGSIRSTVLTPLMVANIALAVKLGYPLPEGVSFQNGEIAFKYGNEVLFFPGLKAALKFAEVVGLIEPDGEDVEQTDPDAQQQPVSQTRVQYTVKEEDTVESVAATQLGDKRFADLIITINRAEILYRLVGNNKIPFVYPGQVIWLPSENELNVFRKNYFVQNSSADGTADGYCAGRDINPYDTEENVADTVFTGGKQSEITLQDGAPVARSLHDEFIEHTLQVRRPASQRTTVRDLPQMQPVNNELYNVLGRLRHAGQRQSVQIEVPPRAQCQDSVKPYGVLPVMLHASADGADTVVVPQPKQVDVETERLLQVRLLANDARIIVSDLVSDPEKYFVKLQMLVEGKWTLVSSYDGGAKAASRVRFGKNGVKSTMTLQLPAKVVRSMALEDFTRNFRQYREHFIANNVKSGSVDSNPPQPNTFEKIGIKSSGGFQQTRMEPAYKAVRSA